MTVNIRVYPNKLNADVFEELQCEAGLTIEQWLVKTVPAYKKMDEPPFSVVLDGIDVGPEFWPICVLKEGNILECFVEPKDPVTATLIVIAVVSAAAAIYYANQPIPDTYNSTVPQGSPVYSVNAQGNQPRLMGVIPRLFGRHKMFPDYLTAPYRLYEGNAEYFYAFMCVCKGRVSLSTDEIFIGNTKIADFGNDVEVEIFEPGADVSGNKASENIYSIPEVTDFELKGGYTYNYNVSTARGRRGLADNSLAKLQDNGYGTWLDAVNSSSDVIEIFSGPASILGFYRYVRRYVEGSSDGATELQQVDRYLNPTGNLHPFASLGSREVFDMRYRHIKVGGAGDFVGPYAISPQSVDARKLYLNFSFPSGLGVVGSNGVVSSFTVKISTVLVFDDGSEQIIPHTFTAQTTSERAFTEEVLLSGPGLPRVGFYRVTDGYQDVSVRDQCRLVSVTSVVDSKTSYEGVTTMAVKIRGTNVLSSNSENKISCIPTAHLNHFNDAGQLVFGETKDISAAVLECWTDSGNPQSSIDMDELWRLHQIWKARGDEFNAVFDNATTAWDAIKRILAVGFAEPTLDYGQLIPIRDEKRDSIRYMYGPQNTLPDSWKMSASLFDASEPDGVEVEYMDGSGGSWKSATILCTLPGEYGENPEKVRAYGITDRDKAYQFGMRKRSAIRYRRKQYKFATEMDGLNSNYLSYDGLGVEMPSYSQTGSLLSFSGRSLVLSEDVAFESGTHYITLRKPDGTASGPYVCIQGSASNEVVVASDLDFTPVINGRQEPPLYMFGTADSWCERVLIKDIKPIGTDRVNLTAVNDDDRVYLYDDALAPD